MDDESVWRQSRRIEELIGKLEAGGDPGIVAVARELVQALLELQGAGLARTLDIVRDAGAVGQQILERISRDELVGTLLPLYGLHPLDLQTRVRQAVEKVQAKVRPPGSVELLQIADGVVKIRVRGAGSLRAAVEAAIYQAAPDLTGLVVEGGEESGFVPLAKLTGAAV